jgi:hypothetical protein
MRTAGLKTCATPDGGAQDFSPARQRIFQRDELEKRPPPAFDVEAEFLDLERPIADGLPAAPLVVARHAVWSRQHLGKRIEVVPYPSVLC